MTGIEHPDHTGASANPLAPWNQGEPEGDLVCMVCLEPPEGDSAAGEGDPCENTAPMTHPDTGEPIPPCHGHYEWTCDP